MSKRIEGPDLTSEDGWRARLGRRVSLRFTLEDGSGISEAAGVVAAVDRGDDGIVRLRVVTRRGEERTAPLAGIVAAKEL